MITVKVTKAELEIMREALVDAFYIAKDDGDISRQRSISKLEEKLRELGAD